jgi:polyvinyl alcohol dehydrogenase (cytochrome)
MRYRPLCRALAAVALVTAASGPARAGQAPADAGATVFQRECAACHLQGPGRTGPTVDALRELTPEAIVTALSTGRMRVQGEGLSDVERRAVAEFLTGRTMFVAAPSAATATAGRCTLAAPLPRALAGPQWNGWGVTARNTRYQPAVQAKLDATDVPRLRLKWAFGFPDVLAARTQPTVVGGRLFTATESGDVLALDAKTGCILWTYRARSSVRTAMTVVPYGAAGSDADSRLALYFGDGRAHAYAVDAESGRELWVRKLDDHPNATITGAPAVHGNRVYVPISAAGEEVRGGRPDYACCSFRGSVSSLDAATGAVVWKTYTIDEAPRPRGTSSAGVQLFGPAGAAIWGAPTIDAGRGLLYVGTGNGFADPPQPSTDAVIALDLATGRVRWIKQTVPNDVWIWQCAPTNTDNPNCPATQGPDFDISSSPVLATTPGGRDLVIVAQKSGVVYALDPDRAGAVVWEYRVGEGSALGGQWGAAVDERRVYIGSAAALSASPGGMHAIELDTGKRAWFTPPRPTLCPRTEQHCTAAQGAAVTAIPGVVFSGSYDGGLRAYSTTDGGVLWQVDTNREYQTVNGVKARGATLDGGGAVVVDGMLYVNSGYNGIVGRSGNVLLAFEVR